ncbi:MAG TPA: Maf family protein [Sphaerochaeta sp.]|nr:Maf family protein [Sphaerochaeta sp.]
MLSAFCSQIILASASPARRALLEEAGLQVEVIPTEIDERSSEQDPAALVVELALRKLHAFLADNAQTDLPVLTCDTTIFFAETLIGKSSCRQEAQEQLAAFSGSAHQVYSGWALSYKGQIISDFDLTTVHFHHLSEETIEDYLATGEWQGAAGSYRIQGAGAALIASIEGDESCVIGIPMDQLARRLATLC